GNITGVTAVTAGGQSAQFDIAFKAASDPGVYTMTIDSNVQDPNGNYVDQNHDGIPNSAGDNYTDGFTIQLAGTYGPDAFGYTAVSNPFQTISMTGATGITFTNTDDGAATMNLGTDTFNFYGTTYTGASSLYVSTNGLITFGGADPTNQYDNDAGLASIPTPV